jgi:hypothetical protein
VCPVFATVGPFGRAPCAFSHTSAPSNVRLVQTGGLFDTAACIRGDAHPYTRREALPVALGVTEREPAPERRPPGDAGGSSLLEPTGSWGHAGAAGCWVYAPGVSSRCHVQPGPGDALPAGSEQLRPSRAEGEPWGRCFGQPGSGSHPGSCSPRYLSAGWGPPPTAVPANDAGCWAAPPGVALVMAPMVPTPAMHGWAAAQPSVAPDVYGAWSCRQPLCDGYGAYGVGVHEGGAHPAGAHCSAPVYPCAMMHPMMAPQPQLVAVGSYCHPEHPPPYAAPGPVAQLRQPQPQPGPPLPPKALPLQGQWVVTRVRPESCEMGWQTGAPTPAAAASSTHAGVSATPQPQPQLPRSVPCLPRAAR